MGRKPVVVVGAGPTGLMLAAELARRGTEVRIIERSPVPASESRANGVHSRTLEQFDRLGIAGELVARGNPVTAFNIMAGTRRILHVDFRRLDGPYPFALIVPQYETQALLDRYLSERGAAVERQVELLQLHQDPDRVVLVTSGGTIEASYVVGCDGAHSTVRHELGMPFAGHGYGLDWLGADVDVDWEYPETEARIFAGRHGVLACLPFGAGRWRVMAAQVANRPEERARPGLEEVKALVALRGPAGMRISNPTWLGAFRAARRSAPHYRQSRVLLAGDAVHIHSPAAGQGMNTGLGDAANLGWKLALVAAGRAEERLLDSYERERAPVARDVIRLTHALVRITGADLSPAARAARNWLLPPLTTEPHVARTIARRFAQHAVSYATSPLTLPSPRKDPLGCRLRPGDRAPDVAELPLAGRPTSLFALLRHPGHTLLVAGEAGLLPGELRRAMDDGHEEGGLRIVVVDPAGPVGRRYGLPAGWACLIRPDGYLAAIGPAAALRPSLEELLTAASPAARRPPVPTVATGAGADAS